MADQSESSTQNNIPAPMEFTGERYVPPLTGQIKYDHLHRYAIASQLTAGTDVLDLACGEGYGANLLASTAASVVGVDNSPDVISYASRRYVRSNLSFLLGSCDSIPLPTASVDAVVSFETIEHHDKHHEMMHEVRRVLRPNGVLVISTPDRLKYSDEPSYKNPFHVKEFYRDEFETLLKRYFGNVQIYGQRVATASFANAIDGTVYEKWIAYTGDVDHLVRGAGGLQSPVYFIALCSDDPGKLESCAFNSVYLDPNDDLLKHLEREWLQIVKQLQSTLHSQEGALAQKTEEVANLRTEREALGQRILQRGQAITALNGEREALQGTIRRQEAILAQKQQEITSLTKEREGLRSTLGAIYASHGWKALSVYYRWRDKVLLRRSIGKVFWIPVTAWKAIRLLRDMRLIAASGLFDSVWYLEQNPDVARAGVNPLRHYLHRGALEGRDPNPLFDSDWYLQQNPDVARAGLNPLRHYVRQGALEGRDPNPLFDSDWYLQQNPDVAKAGVNPLAHFLGSGATERSVGNTGAFPDWRDGNSRWGKDMAGPEDWPLLDPHPMVCSARPVHLPGGAAAHRLICVSHVLPYTSGVGNEYRIHRMLHWLAGQGSEIFLVICPLPGDLITAQQLTDACSVYSNLILCQRDGTLLYHLEDGGAPMEELAGAKPRAFGKLLGEEEDGGAIAQKLLLTLRSFCPDLLIEVLLHLDGVLKPDVLLMESVFLTRPLPLIRPRVLKVVDTLGMFSINRHNITQFGTEDKLRLTEEEETALLNRADLVIAIQPDQAEEVRQLVPNKIVVTAGIDSESTETVPVLAHDPVILSVISDDSMNVEGLRNFLRYAWPLIRREVPGAQLRLAGAVGIRVDVDDPAIKIVGPIDNVAAAYSEARVVANLVVAGPNSAIETMKALSYLRPIVTWPSGAEGIEDEMKTFCPVATDWYSFARHVIDLCNSDDVTLTLISKREEVRRRFSADSTYQALCTAFSTLLAESGQAARAAAGGTS